MSKPPFDPTQPFESSKPPFDPNQPFQKTGEAPQGSMYDRFSAGAQDAMNSVADVSANAQQAVMGPVIRGIASGGKMASRAAFGTEAPANALGQAMQYAPSKIDQFGNYAAETIGKNFPNMPAIVPATVGWIAANAPYYINPSPKIGGTFLKPLVPAERSAAVEAAQRAGVQLTRAEQTGGKFMAGAENFLEKTPLGSGPMQQQRLASDAQMMAYKDQLNSKMGTPRQNYDIGVQAQQGLDARSSAMNTQRSKMFDAVPDNVHIPQNESRNLADTIMSEQADYYPSTRNPDISTIARDVQGSGSSVSNGAAVGNGPETRGYTYRTPDQVIPGENVIHAHEGELPPNGSYSVSEDGSVNANENAPTHYTSEQMPDRNIEGKNVYAAKTSFPVDNTISKTSNASGGLPVVQPGPATDAPYALFDYNDPITGRSSYKIHGDANSLGYKTVPNVPIETVEQHGLRVTGKTQKAADLGHEPLDAVQNQTAPTAAQGDPKSNYQQLKRLRETVSAKAQDARNAGDFAKERDFLRMKSSIDKDIDNFVSNQDTPLGSMMGQEFADSYRKANAFSGAYKKLFKSDLSNAITNSPPEKILDSVFQKNNETAIKQFRALVGDDAFQSAKKKWVSDLLESPDVAKELSDKKIDPGTLNAILTPTEQKSLSEYGSVQQLRKTVGGVQGTNGSARSNVHIGTAGAAGAALAALLHGNYMEAGAIGAGIAAPYPLAKALVQSANGVHVAIPNAVSKAAMAEFVNRVITKKNANGQQ